MAATPHLVRISEVGECVRQVVEDLNAKLYAMNLNGHFIEMPEELSFSMVVLKEFEALTSSDAEVSEGIEKQGGYATETQKSSSSDQRKSDETGRSDGRNSHVNNGTRITTTEGV